MSRCFPFPPPGYEKKSALEDNSLIIEEKHKKKKHKEKKGKDKKEKKERKEKERSEGEHKEDKERKKKKHRDKKDKRKDKRKSLTEKDIVGSLENQNGEKLGPNTKSSDGIQDHRILIELEKRVRNDDEATGSQMLHKISFAEQRMANLLGKVEENCGGMLANGQSLKFQSRGFGNGSVGNFNRENQHKVENDSCQVEKVELGKRVRNNDEATCNQMLHKSTFVEQRKANLLEKVKENCGGMLTNGQSLKFQSRGLGNGVGNFDGENQHKVENYSCQVEKVELGKRVRNDDEERGSQMLPKITFVEQRKANLLGKVEENSGGMLTNGQSLKVQSRGLGNGFVGNSNGAYQHKVENGSCHVEKVELGRRVRNDDEATGSKMLHKITFVEQRKSNLLGKVEENSGAMLANGRSLKVESRDLGNGSVGNFNGEFQHKVENDSCRVEKVDKRKEKKEKKKHENGDGKGDGRKNDDRDKKTKAEDKKRKREEKKEKKREKKKDRSKDKIKQRERGDPFLDFGTNRPSEILKENRESNGNLPKLKESELNGLLHDFGNNKPSDILKESRDSHGNLTNRKEPETNGFLHDNGIRPNGISGLASSPRQVSQNGNGFSSPQLNLTTEKGAVITNHKVNGKLSSSQPPLKNIRNTEPGQTPNNFTAESSRPISSNHLGSNGLISSRPITNNHVASNGLVSSNVLRIGRKMEQPCEITKMPPRPPRPPPVMDASVNGQEANVTPKMDNKGSMMNGILEGKKYNSSKPPPSASGKAKEKVDKSVKPPHPDSKYLSQILSVPKVEYPQLDDQEWLFGCKDSRSKRLELGSSEIEGTNPVWAEAIRIESADVTALPYVVPY
ncbi:hypothetical protein ACJIZ3_012313 [Penstemon smallii]|uniref:Uncharacterized protein n=1 Tax=Penstemon smallii TaxID=265156 RepID=A0ABD3ULL8_9LAMI